MTVLFKRRGLSHEEQVAAMRCKGHLSARATAREFGVSHTFILHLWSDGPTPDYDVDSPPFPTRWRCARCLALVDGDQCVCGEKATWIKEQEYMAQVTRELEEEG